MIIFNYRIQISLICIDYLYIFFKEYKFVYFYTEKEKIEI